MRLAPLLRVVPFAVAWHVAPAQALPNDTARRLEEYLTTEIAAEHVPGLSAAIVRNGTLIWSRGFGAANLEAPAAATDSTVYAIMSVGKQFTATAVMILAERGAVSLDDPIRKYVAGLPASYETVRVRHLLSHTAGIPEYTEVPGWRGSIRLDRTPQTLMDPVYALPLEFAPGTRFHYSNSGYLLLGMLLESVGKKPFADVIADLIFKPLGMTATRYNDMNDIIPRRAAGYVWTRSGVKTDEYVSPSQQWAAGAFVSTVVDLAIWEATGATLLTRAAGAQMTSPAVLASGTEPSYGIGNELFDDHGHRVAGHQGGGVGFNATVLRYVDDKISVIVLTNARAAQSKAMARHVASFIIPGLSDTDNPGVADSDPALSRRLHGVVIAAAGGTVDTALFAPELRAGFASFIRTAGPRMLGSLGALQSFVLLADEQTGGKHIRRYRAHYDTRTLIWTFELNADGLIRSLEPVPE